MFNLWAWHVRTRGPLLCTRVRVCVRAVHTCVCVRGLYLLRGLAVCIEQEEAHLPTCLPAQKMGPPRFGVPSKYFAFEELPDPTDFHTRSAMDLARDWLTKAVARKVRSTCQHMRPIHGAQHTMRAACTS